MRWITDAGLRFWQAYREGLEMSCPVHNRMADALAERLCERDRNHDAAMSHTGPDRSTLH
ncbi:hypothetical protein [Novosphingobium sp. 17-62-19]|uniref:hypothetical protein n=1 Tax=Novosphingobium sp. 17-62-19 TaxID=1970406 RepID=UPI0025CE7397|nr:hypothetical protein [Novosphingobium sp. 17-62-19]HQS96909.1 hypothetical protein [Novosphingobium sp.]